jgi:hypothetical protein
MGNWAPILYREFWDVPRIFIARYRQQSWLFDCPFDEATEDFPGCYKVYLLPELKDEDLAGSWNKLPSRAIQYVGEVPVKAVRFDPSKRREIDSKVLDELTAQIGTSLDSSH